jgi:indolepyruvate decarboxylase
MRYESRLLGNPRGPRLFLDGFSGYSPEVTTKRKPAQPTNGGRETVVGHVLSRLRDIGISDIFGVAGDFSFPVLDAIARRPDMRWVGCCNELNAAYAADGYARVKGIAAVSSTFGVGELGALGGIAGAYAEHVPLFHLVGMPSAGLQARRALVHHTLGNGEYKLFCQIAEHAVCAQAILTPQNAAFETERLIAQALYHRRPVYMAFPTDLANQAMLSAAEPLPSPRSDSGSLKHAADAIFAALAQSRTAGILPGILVARAGLQAELQALVDASGLPFGTMFMDKCVLDEQQPAYAGMYCGALMNRDVREFVEGCDWVLAVGTMFTDLNTGAFTARLNPSKLIDIGHHSTRVGATFFPNVEMRDILATLANRISKSQAKRQPHPTRLGKIAGRKEDPITAETLYPRWEKFLRPGDILVSDTGTTSLGLAFAHMPKSASFLNQPLWGAIGWATPAAFGAAVAAPQRRVVLVTGEGAHQVSVQEISQFARLRLRPVVFVLNNSGYLIERLLSKDPESKYNDVAQWRYAELPRVLGCDGWFTARVTTLGELDDALQTAATGDGGSYIEVVMDPYSAPPLAKKFHERSASLYGTPPKPGR